MHLYGQYCPVARAAEILADRWTVLIIRELLADVSHFNELERGLPHMSRTLLAERLRRLEHAGVLERRGAARGKPTEYRLTPAGQELQAIIDQYRRMGRTLGFRRSPAERARSDHPALVDAAPRVHGGDRPAPCGHSVRFALRPAPKLWLLIEPADVSVCLKNPRFDIDVIVSADITAFYRVWLGRERWPEALRRGQVQIEGTPADIRAFPGWFTWSPMADRVRAALPAVNSRSSNRAGRGSDPAIRPARK